MTTNQHRVFQPVILFHDHSFSPLSGVTHHIHIPIGDPYYTPLIEQKKNQVEMMLQSNGKVWYHIIQNSRQQASPKPTHFIHERVDKTVESDDEYTTASSHEEESDNSKQDRKRRGNLPKSVTAVLRQWLIDHCKNPYPTEAEKIHLKDKTGLTLNQISNWFINARRRLLPQILDDHQQEDMNDPMPTVNKRKRKPEQQDILLSSSSTTHGLRKRRKYIKKNNNQQ